MINIEKQLAETVALVEKFKVELKQEIQSLPDNPKIQRLAPRNCFVIMSGDLGNNWAPEHHDFKKQHELLSKEIEIRQADSIIPFLRKAIADGKWRDRSGHCWHTLHPEVIKHLQHLLRA